MATHDEQEAGLDALLSPDVWKRRVVLWGGAIAVVMTFGGTLVGLAHLANLRLNHGHVHDASCAH